MVGVTLIAGRGVGWSGGEGDRGGAGGFREVKEYALLLAGYGIITLFFFLGFSKYGDPNYVCMYKRIELAGGGGFEYETSGALRSSEESSQGGRRSSDDDG